MATFSAVNTTIQVPESTQAGGERTPTTPRPPPTQSQSLNNRPNDESAPTTPTNRDFGGVAGQRPLPDEPLTPAHAKDAQLESQESLKRDSTQRSPLPLRQQDEDVEMGEGEDDNDEDEDSDNDSVTSDSRPSKKKKGQRFFCTEYPPCQLSFTRSEHLARHIRKHTGERPFQCHCSRRFSRLDNLRQHAQTVHVNEEIPGDSLAATSTRFQRQIRTDRVRPPTNRSRASTLERNGGGGYSRGHSRNLSTSSIGSTTSSVGVSEDARRRPQPLAMANDPTSRARLSLDTYNGMAGTPLQQPFAYYNQSPTGYSTPTSTAFSTGNGSPRFQSNMASPVSTLSRSSFYNGARRRLSVPNASPFQDQQSSTYPPPVFYQPLPSGTSATFSPLGSLSGSPTGSTFSIGRRDSEAELEYRRRTWHPGTYSSFSQRPATSGLSYHQTPDDQRPAMSGQPAASQVTTRLPGIESFDHAPPTNARQQSSPMMVDASPRPPSSGRPSDAGLQQGLTRLDITAANAPVEAQWQSSQPQMAHPQAYTQRQQPTTVAPQQVQHQQPQSASMPEPPVTPRKNKRQAWYNGPIAPSNSLSHRPSPEDSGSSDGVPTPGTSQGTEYHPVIVNPPGATDAFASGAPTTVVGVAPDDQHQQKVYHHHTSQQTKPEPAQRADSGFQSYVHVPTSQTYVLQAGLHDQGGFPSHYHPHPQANHDMGRLEALVAVATSENRAVERS